MPKKVARKSKTSAATPASKLRIRKETLKDLAPQGQSVKGGSGYCGRTR
jgi:hypothetical protein